MWKQTQELYTQTSAQADWGYWYWATENIANLTYQSGQDVNVRRNFARTGKLPDTEDSNYRAINDRFPVFGYAIDFGMVGATPVETLYTIGLTQEKAIQFDGANGVIEDVPSLWKSYYSTELDAVCNRCASTNHANW